RGSPRARCPATPCRSRSRRTRTPDAAPSTTTPASTTTPKGKQTHSCHTATKGSKCYDAVVEAM
ncbi:unnamed protein product, partial [Prorocentrum cordatum]